VKETVNKDTYQTLKEIRVNSELGEKAVLPMWKPKTNQEEQSPISIFLATPVHSECSIHYAQALLEFQKLCFKKKLRLIFL
jgi:hypothetical protein